MHKILLAANWKMHGDESLLKNFSADFTQTPPPAEVEVVLCLPFVHLSAARQLFQHTAIRWGAQDVSAYLPGAYTGQISAQMLHDFNCSYAIIGHSERREFCGESDNLIAEKFLRLHEVGICPILCVGETEAQYERGETSAVIMQQLRAVVEHVGISAFKGAVIAYEPIWAIGSGKAATPADVELVHSQIARYFAQQDAKIAATIRLIYGGSMNENNVESLIALPSVAGGLVGGASLKPASFEAMIVKASHRI